MSWQIFDFGATGATVIDGANIYTGSILGTSIAAQTITANNIVAGSITTTLLAFTPITSGATNNSNNVINAINADSNGLQINTAKLTLTGILQVNGAAADVNSGSTTILGGKITANSIGATQLQAGSITTDKLTVGAIQRVNLCLNGHFGSYNATGNSSSGWTVSATAVFHSQAGSYTPNSSVGVASSAMPVPSFTETTNSDVFASQQISVTPGRTYTVVGLLTGSGGNGNLWLRTTIPSPWTRLSSATAGVAAGTVVPPFYQGQSAVQVAGGVDTSTSWGTWQLFAYKITVPNGYTTIQLEIGSDGNTGTPAITLYPGFIQVYDDNLAEASMASDGVALMQSVAYGGDVSGPYSSLNVRGLQGRLISATAPTTNQVLGWNGTTWSPVAAPLLSGSAFTGAVSASTFTANGVSSTSGLYNGIRMYSGNSDGVTSYPDIRYNGSTNLVISAVGTGAVYFNYEHGTGGVNFCNGALGSVATISSTGAASFSGLVTASLGLTVNWAKTTLAAAAAGYATLNIPNSATNPTSPVNGDIWMSSGKLVYQNNSITQALDPFTTLGDTDFGGTSGVQTRLAGNTSAIMAILKAVSAFGVMNSSHLGPFFITMRTKETPSLA